MELKITDMQRDASTGVVKNISWFAFVRDGNLQADDAGVVEVPFKDPTDQGFVPFDEITPEVAAHWVAGVVDLQAVQQQLEAKVLELKAPTVLSGAPWQQ